MSTRAMSDKIEIDITSDTVCPWCYVGKRRLEKAIKELEVRSGLYVLSKECQLVSVKLIISFRNLLPIPLSTLMLNKSHLYSIFYRAREKSLRFGGTLSSLIQVCWNPKIIQAFV